MVRAEVNGIAMGVLRAFVWRIKLGHRQGERRVDGSGLGKGRSSLATLTPAHTQSRCNVFFKR